MTALTSPGASAPAPAAASAHLNLPLRAHPFDWFFIVVFSLFIVTSMISDMLPTLGVDFSQPSPNFLVNASHWYAHDTDPLFMDPPVWMRFVTGLSAFAVRAHPHSAARADAEAAALHSAVLNTPTARLRTGSGPPGRSGLPFDQVPTALDFSRSNSLWLMVPASRRAFAFAISSAELAPATLRM